NCGIFGGTNIAAIQRYCADVIDLVSCEENKAGWLKVPVTVAMSCVIEQQTLWCSAREQGVTLTPLFENTDFADAEFFRQKAMRVNFNHAAAEGKNPTFGSYLGKRVEEEFSQQYAILNEIYPRTMMELETPTLLQFDDDAEDGT